MNPIKTAKQSEPIIMPGVNAKENAISENDSKFIVDIEKNCRNEAMKIPITPPITAMVSDSIRKAKSMLRLLNPNDLKVPISTVRFATAEYIVIIAPMVAPKLNIMVTKIPRTLIKVDIISDCAPK